VPTLCVEFGLGYIAIFGIVLVTMALASCAVSVMYVKWSKNIGNWSQCKYTYVIVWSCFYLCSIFNIVLLKSSPLFVSLVTLGRFHTFAHGKKEWVEIPMTFHYLSKASHALANFTENIRCLNLQYSWKNNKGDVYTLLALSRQRECMITALPIGQCKMCVNIKGKLNLNTYIKSCVRKNRNLHFTNIHVLCHVMDVSRGGWKISYFRDSNVQFLCVLVQPTVLHLTTGF
jgi:hypothetical protein